MGTGYKFSVSLLLHPIFLHFEHGIHNYEVDMAGQRRGEGCGVSFSSLLYSIFHNFEYCLYSYEFDMRGKSRERLLSQPFLIDVIHFPSFLCQKTYETVIREEATPRKRRRREYY